MARRRRRVSLLDIGVSVYRLVERQRRQAAAYALWQQQQAQVAAAWQRRQQAIMAAPTLNSLLAVTPTEFEGIVGHVLRCFYGYVDAQVTQTTGDRGVDVFLADQYGWLAVQCKQYAPDRTVGGPELRDFIGAMHLARVPRGFFVTTAKYTKAARDAARAANITLIDGVDLVNIVRAVGA